MTNLTVNPFDTVYQGVFQALVDAMPKTDFIAKAPIIVPYSDVRPTTFTITANPGDHVDLYVNDRLAVQRIAPDSRFTVDVQLEPGYNFIRVQTAMESVKILIAATNYATLYGAWAEQYFIESGVQIQDMALQLNSRWSLKQTEHQIMWQDLLPGTRNMRILAGKMAVKALINMGPTDEGVTDIAKAITGSTPVIFPTRLDPDLWEPECRLMYASAQDFGGYEFDIWLFNLCAVSWQTFVVLLNNLDDTIYKLKSATDTKVLVDHAGQLESHVFSMDGSGCSIIDLMTRFFDCFSRVKVFVAPSILDEFSICPYGYPFDLAVEFPLGYIRFDSGIVLDNNPQIPFDSSEEADPYPDGWIGVPISCRFDSGNLLDSLSPQVVEGAKCQEVDGRACGFKEPCAAGLVTTLFTAQMGIDATAMVFGGSGSGLPAVWFTDGSATLSRTAPLTYVVDGTVALGAVGRGTCTEAGSVWVCAGDTVVRVDPGLLTVQATIGLPAGSAPQRIVTDGTLLWTANLNGSVSVVDPATNTVTTPITGLVQLRNVRRVGSTLYALATSTDTVYAYDAGTFVLQWSKVLAGAGPYDVFETVGSVWVLGQTSATIEQLDAVTRVLITTTPVAAGPQSFTFMAGTWYVTGSGSLSVQAFDPTTQIVTIPFTLPAGTTPNALIQYAGQYLFGAGLNGSIGVVDVLASTVSATAVSGSPLVSVTCS